jgi:hypothetical protein
MVMCCGVGVMPVSAQDAFVEQHRAAVAANVAGLRFGVRLLDQKGWFYQGELISIELLYESLDGGWHGWEADCGETLACDAMDVALDHTDGVTLSPGHDILESNLFDRSATGVCGCGSPAGMVGGLDGKVVIPPPIRQTTSLNTRIRFDRPGRYRLYLGKHLSTSSTTSAFTVQTSITILDIEIRAQDRTWAAGTLATAVDSLDKTAREVQQIAALETPEAIDEMVRRYERGEGTLDGVEWDDALMRLRDRDRAIRGLERLLVSGHRWSGGFVRALARLQTAREAEGRAPYSHARYRALLEQNAARYANALGADLTDALRQEMENLAGPRVYRRSVAEHSHDGLMIVMHEHPQEALRAFTALRRDTQRTLLELFALRFHHASLLPLLRAAHAHAHAGTNANAAATADADIDHGVSDAALELINAIVPQEGRRLILADLRRFTPRATVRVLGTLPDAALPDLDRDFARLLGRVRTPSALASVMERVQRYGSARLLPSVRAAIARVPRDRSHRAEAASIAYLLRVSPEAGARRLDAVLSRGGLREYRREWLLWAIAERMQMPPASSSNSSTSSTYTLSPQLEGVARAHLGDRDRTIAIDAAQTLSRYGSASAREALQSRLQALRAEPLEPGNRSWQGELERELMDAILKGAAWHTTANEINALGARCLTQECLSFDSFSLRGEPRLAAHLLSRTVNGALDVSFSLLQYNGLTRPELDRKLRQLPAGTMLERRIASFNDSFEFWTPEQRAAVADEIDAIVQSAGLQVARDRVH